MEIAPKKNNSAAESATGICLDTYIGDVNVIILEGNRANFDVSLCDAVHYQTKTSCLVSKDDDKIEDTKVADSETDALVNKEIGGNTTLNIKHKTSRKTKHACNDDITAKYTGTSNDIQNFAMYTMMATEETKADTEPFTDQKCEDTRVRYLKRMPAPL